MNAIRKEIRNRRAYKPSQKCRGCKVYKQLRSVGKELEQISKARRCSKQNKSNKKGEKQ